MSEACAVEGTFVPRPGWFRLNPRTGNPEFAEGDSPPGNGNKNPWQKIELGYYGDPFLLQTLRRFRPSDHHFRNGGVNPED